MVERKLTRTEPFPALVCRRFLRRDCRQIRQASAQSGAIFPAADARRVNLVLLGLE
jgi:hypothetical protein